MSCELAHVIEMDSNKWKQKNMKVKTKREKAAMKYKTYIGNKEEGQGFADKRKKKITHEYHKVIQKEKQKMEEFSARTQKIYEDADKETKTMPKKMESHEKKEKPSCGPTKQQQPSKVSRYHKAETQWKERQEQEDKRKEEFLRRQQERDDALQRYRAKKKKTHKKLAVKNYKGQPNMSAQMELLLEKIEGSKS